MFLILSERHFSIPSRLEWVVFLVPASKSIPRIRAAVTFSRNCGGWKRGRGPLKEWLKVGDKNKLGERRKLIIHNRQFTWMSMTKGETKAATHKKIAFSGSGNLCSATTVVIFIWLHLKWGMQQGIFFEKVKASNNTDKAFISNSPHFMHPL